MHDAHVRGLDDVHEVVLVDELPKVYRGQVLQQRLELRELRLVEP